MRPIANGSRVRHKLSDKHKLSLIGYHDKTANGFGSATEYFTYTANYYSAEKGLIITPGQATKIDWDNPERTDLVLSTTGKNRKHECLYQ